MKSCLSKSWYKHSYQPSLSQNWETNTSSFAFPVLQCSLLTALTTTRSCSHYEKQHYCCMVVSEVSKLPSCTMKCSYDWGTQRHIGEHSETAKSNVMILWETGSKECSCEYHNFTVGCFLLFRSICNLKKQRIRFSSPDIWLIMSYLHMKILKSKELHNTIWDGRNLAQLVSWDVWKQTLYSRQSFNCPFLPTDTAIKVQAAKDKARQANNSANDVLAQIKDLNQNLLGLRNNYSKLADDVAKTNAVVKDPIKNSKFFFAMDFLLLLFWFSFYISKWNRHSTISPL